MKNTMKELSLNEMEQANGGYIYVIYEGIAYYVGVEMYRCEIINDKTGNVMDFTDDLDKAIYWATNFYHQSTEVIDWDTLEKLRKDAGVI